MLIFHKQKIGISPDWLSSKGQIIIFFVGGWAITKKNEFLHRTVCSEKIVQGEPWEKN